MLSRLCEATTARASFLSCVLALRGGGSSGTRPIARRWWRRSSPTRCSDPRFAVMLAVIAGGYPTVAGYDESQPGHLRLGRAGVDRRGPLWALPEFGRAHPHRRRDHRSSAPDRSGLASCSPPMSAGRLRRPHALRRAGGRGRARIRTLSPGDRSPTRCRVSMLLATIVCFSCRYL